MEKEKHHHVLKDEMTHLVESAELAEKQKNLWQESVQIAQKNYENTLLKYEAGRTALFEVEIMRDKWRDAQNQYLSQEILFYNTLANVELHAGLLGEKWLSSY